MNIRNIAFIIFTILPAPPGLADNGHKVNGNCVDNFTNEPVSGATAVLMTADSVALDTAITSCLLLKSLVRFRPSLLNYLSI